MNMLESEIDKGSSLHQEIFDALKRDNIDPFERPCHDKFDGTISQSLTVRPQWPTNRMAYWRNSASNLKFLEKKSLEHMKDLQKETKVVRKAKSHQKLPKFQSYTKSFKFAATKDADIAAYFDHKVIGNLNTITELIQHHTGEIVKNIEKIDLKSNAFRPGDIGGKVKGGIFEQSKSRPPAHVSITQTCDFYTTEELDKLHHNARAVPFTCANRNTSTLQKSQGDRMTDTTNPNTLQMSCSNFTKEDRFVSLPNTSLKNPAVGTYKLTRMFEDSPPKLTHERATELISMMDAEETIRKDSSFELSQKVVFGYGCNFEEHKKYGLCLDGKCGRRGKWEDVSLITNNVERIIGTHEKANIKPLVKQESMNLTDEDRRIRAKYSKQSSNANKNRNAIVATPPAVSPLLTASLNGDIQTIKILFSLGYDMNCLDQNNKRNILHNAVDRGHTELVRLLAPDKYAESNSPYLGVIQLNAQDKDGNTPLHIASMKGLQILVEILCDAGCEINTIKNLKGETSLDSAKTQRIFQLLKMGLAKLDTEKELAMLMDQNEKLKSKQSRRRISSSEKHRQCGSGVHLTSASTSPHRLSSSIFGPPCIASMSPTSPHPTASRSISPSMNTPANSNALRFDNITPISLYEEDDVLHMPSIAYVSSTPNSNRSSSQASSHIVSLPCSKPHSFYIGVFPSEANAINRS